MYTTTGAGCPIDCLQRFKKKNQRISPKRIQMTSHDEPHLVFQYPGKQRRVKFAQVFCGYFCFMILLPQHVPRVVNKERRCLWSRQASRGESFPPTFASHRGPAQAPSGSGSHESLPRPRARVFASSRLVRATWGWYQGPSSHYYYHVLFFLRFSVFLLIVYLLLRLPLVVPPRRSAVAVGRGEQKVLLLPD